MGCQTWEREDGGETEDIRRKGLEGEGVFEVGGTEASDRAGECLGRCI